MREWVIITNKTCLGGSRNDVIGLRQRFQRFFQLLDRCRVPGQNFDPHDDVQFLVFCDRHDGSDRGAEYALNLDSYLLDHGAVAQIVLYNLADRRNRQGIEQDHAFWLCRGFGNVLLEVVLKQEWIELRPWRGNDVEDRYFSCIGIGHSDSRAHLNTGKSVSDVLNVGGIDVVAASNDQILRPASQNQPVVIGQITDIAGIEPTVWEQDFLIVLRVDIAREHLWPLDENDAARLRRANLAAFTGIEADDPGPRERRPKSDAPPERASRGRD